MSEVFKLTKREDRPATIEEHKALRAEIAGLRLALADIGKRATDEGAYHLAKLAALALGAVHR